MIFPQASLKQVAEQRILPVMGKHLPSSLDVLAAVTRSRPEDWQVLDGPDSGVGIDYWFRNTETGAEAYLNLDQDHLTISLDEERIYDGLLP
ncbi:MAG TPA: hypothetical protein VG146_07950 [Verrucomicrobiae bacterium]|nr:hypothetical protein [Verrucomicrobiae bacterium]